MAESADQSHLAHSLVLLEQILGEKCQISKESLKSEEIMQEEEKNKSEINETTDAVTETGSQRTGNEDSDGDTQDDAGLEDESLKLDLVLGQRAPVCLTFCPWSIAKSYPSFYIGKTNKPRAWPFFKGILKFGSWDFFYIHNPNEPEAPARLLVPTPQFQRFLDFINNLLDINLEIPRGPPREKFLIRFNENNTPYPRFLAHHEKRKWSREPPKPESIGDDNEPVGNEENKESRDPDRKSTHISESPDSWPKINDEDLSAFEAASPEAKEHWLTVWDTLEAPMAASLEERIARRKARANAALKQAQEFLGLNGEEREIVFVCIDFEALEVGSHPVSESGICILDTSQVAVGNPGRGGEQWWPAIEAHHLRTSEYRGLRNYRFVQGCPDNFDFGESVFVREACIADAIIDILDPFTSKGRKIALVGHDLQGDIRYLGTIGINIMEIANVVGQVDTQIIHKAWRDSLDQRSLSKVLDDLNFSYRYMHNAGNDAMYTLRAMLGIAVAALEEQEDGTRT